jgi:hypothetical protein
VIRLGQNRCGACFPLPGGVTGPVTEKKQPPKTPVMSAPHSLDYLAAMQSKMLRQRVLKEDDDGSLISREARERDNNRIRLFEENQRF